MQKRSSGSHILLKIVSENRFSGKSYFYTTHPCGGEAEVDAGRLVRLLVLDAVRVVLARVRALFALNKGFTVAKLDKYWHHSHRIQNIGKTLPSLPEQFSSHQLN